MACRIRAMEAMAHEGWHPTLVLWEEPETLMSNLRAVRSLTHNTREVVIKYRCLAHDLKLQSPHDIQPASGPSEEEPANATGGSDDELTSSSECPHDGEDDKATQVYHG
jgi:hypothetical protein